LRLLHPAAGNSSTVRNYQYVHQGPFKTSLQHYYRILQRDLDGKFSYSKVIWIDYPEGARDLVLYPNPASDVLHVSITERLELRLVNTQGVVVWKGVLPAGRHEIPVSNFAAGNYILQAGKETYKAMIR
jgi:Secretion system C-terminal sorting domain